MVEEKLSELGREPEVVVWAKRHFWCGKLQRAQAEVEGWGTVTGGEAGEEGRAEVSDPGGLPSWEIPHRSFQECDRDCIFEKNYPGGGLGPRLLWQCPTASSSSLCFTTLLTCFARRNVKLCCLLKLFFIDKYLEGLSQCEIWFRICLQTHCFSWLEVPTSAFLLTDHL